MKTWIITSIVGIVIATTIVHAQQKLLFHGIEIREKRDMKSYLDYQKMQSFGTQSDQIELITNLIALLYAYHGIISFPDTGIKGVTDKTTADAYVLDFYTTKWSQLKTLEAEGDTFIKDNETK